jgi:hypothetical protein
MRLVAGIALFVVAMAFAMLRHFMPPAVPPKVNTVAIERIANGKIAPQVGLLSPLPAWIPLPLKGRVIGAETLPPQPPWGASAVVMLQLEQPADDFVAAYRQRLDRAGFPTRRIPIPANLIIDAADSAFEGDERNGGHAVFITMRKTHYAQLTFWSPPVPRM